MILCVEGWREVCCGIVRGGGGRSIVVLYVGGWRSVVVLFVEEGSREVCWGVVFGEGREVCCGVVRGGGREVWCGIVRGEMEGGLLWCCTWRGRDVRYGDVFGGGR